MVLRREQERRRYAGFNLVLADPSGAWLLSNRDEAGVTRLPHGLYGVSNATLDKPWAKVKLRHCAATVVFRVHWRYSVDVAAGMAALARVCGVLACVAI